MATIPPTVKETHMMQLKRKSKKQTANGNWIEVEIVSDYLPVQGRLLWLHSEKPKKVLFEVVSEDIRPDLKITKQVWEKDPHTNKSAKVDKFVEGWAKVTMRVTIVMDDDRELMAEGTKTESAADFGDYVEKAQTGAIGRALLFLGYGTAFAADELDEAHRIVDSPVDPPAPAPTPSNAPSGRSNAQSVSRPSAPASPAPVSADRSLPTDAERDAKITEEQLNTIRKLCERLGKTVPTNVIELSYLAARKVIRELTTEYREKQQASKSA